MASRDDPSADARRQITTDLRGVLDDIRSTRVELGLSQAELAGAARVSVDQLSRIERRLVERPSLDQLAGIAAGLGMRLRLNLYPQGEPIRDRVQVPGLVAFRKRVHPSMAWRSEVPLPIVSDRRAWDAVVIDDDRTWTGIEWISRFGAVDATLRRANQKLRDDPRISRLVLVLADTVRNRSTLRAGVSLVRPDFPLDTREVLAALAAGRAPALNGVVLVRVSRDTNGSPAAEGSPEINGGRPQAVHNGGNLVDGSGGAPPRFVENPVGAAFTEP